MDILVFIDSISINKESEYIYCYVYNYNIIYVLGIFWIRRLGWFFSMFLNRVSFFLYYKVIGRVMLL